MKVKCLFCVLMLSVLLLISGCTFSNAGVEDGDDVLYIVTTIFPPYDFIREITDGAENVRVQQLLRPGQESHTFDPTPADMIAVEQCDLFICTGGESDAWVDVILSAVAGGEEKCVRMIELVEAVEESAADGTDDHHGHDHTHGDGAHDRDVIEYDEHVWTDPDNAVRITRALCESLCEIAPEEAARFRTNTDSYVNKLVALDAVFQGIAQRARYRTLVFGDRFPMRYLCDAMGLGYRAAFPGCAAESEPSAATMIALIEKIKAEGTPAVLKIEMSSASICDAISDETGVPVLTIHSCHNRTAAEAASGKTYLDLMYENARVLEIALDCSAQ